MTTMSTSGRKWSLSSRGQSADFNLQCLQQHLDGYIGECNRHNYCPRSLEYRMVTISRRSENWDLHLWGEERIYEERIMWVGKKEKCLILMFHFGQGVRCPGKDWIGDARS